MNLANRVLISCKTSRPTLFQAKLTGLAVIPMGISGAAMRLMSPRRLSGEYSRGKVPNVVANSTDNDTCNMRFTGRLPEVGAVR